jgi:hypothetical protein
LHYLPKRSGIYSLRLEVQLEAKLDLAGGKTRTTPFIDANFNADMRVLVRGRKATELVFDVKRRMVQHIVQRAAEAAPARKVRRVNMASYSSYPTGGPGPPCWLSDWGASRPERVHCPGLGGVGEEAEVPTLCGRPGLLAGE